VEPERLLERGLGVFLAEWARVIVASTRSTIVAPMLTPPA
jgi:hypothetical protein